jgi:antagonist of KipI
LDSRIYPELDDKIVRVLEGPEFSRFTAASVGAFLNSDFQISRAADRMGYRLDGPRLAQKQQEEMLSAAVNFGTVQVPGNGNPIVLMADHQTVGGYPRIAQIITADHTKIAQLQSGQSISFRLVSLAEAHQALIDREKQLRQLRQSLSLKYKKS